MNIFQQFKHSTHLSFASIIFLFIPGLLCCSALTAQVQRTDYKVLFHGDSVGNMQVYKQNQGNNVCFTLVTDVRVRFFIRMNMQSKDTASFQGGRLTYSNVSRLVNGKEKAAKQIKANGNIYQATSFGKPVPAVDKPINYNLGMLYTQEPFNKQVIYSDNFQQFLAVEEVSPHKYKIALPDGNYNYYTFKDGICNSAELHHSLYTIYLELNS